MTLREANRKKPSGDVYDVFARTRDEARLHQVGDVIAPNRALARAYAFQMYQESPWIEMIVVPRSEIVTILDRT